jgi:hypothetical protein
MGCNQQCRAHSDHAGGDTGAKRQAKARGRRTGLTPQTQYLLDRFKVPEYQVRFRWTPNAVVICDKRATQHYPVADYWPARRHMERVTIRGDVPFGPIKNVDQ